MFWTSVIVLAGLVGGYVLWARTGGTPSGNAKKSGEKGDKKGGKRGAGGGGADAPMPVVAVRAHKGNIGIYLNGLGTVTPISTVTVRSRVDGELLSVRYHEGDLVHKGDLLAEIDPRPFQAQLTQYEGQYQRDKATLENARTDVARYQTLLKQNAIPEQQLTTQVAAVGQAEGVLKADQGQIDAVKLNLIYCRITAPLTGRVGLRLVDPGNIVQAGDAAGLVVITQMDPISVLFTVAEDQLPQVLQKMRAWQRLPVDAYDREMKKQLSRGSLTTVDNQIDQTTGTIRMRATFDNRNTTLFPNQFVNARLLVEEKRNVVLLNSAAIQRTSNSVFVYLVKPDSTVTVRNLETGVTEGENTEITSGVEPNDVAVMTGADKLQEGSHVRAQIPGEAQPKNGPARKKK